MIEEQNPLALKRNLTQIPSSPRSNYNELPVFAYHLKSCFGAARFVGVCGNQKIQSLLQGVVGLMKLIFLKAFKQMFLKEQIDRTVIIILVKINHSGKAFSHYSSVAATSYSNIRNMYKNTLASEYSILLLIPTPVLELGLLARDCQRKRCFRIYSLALKTNVT